MEKSLAGRRFKIIEHNFVFQTNFSNDYKDTIDILKFWAVLVKEFDKFD